jgi:hypothetical protein
MRCARGRHANCIRIHMRVERVHTMGYEPELRVAALLTSVRIVGRRATRPRAHPD